MTSSLLLIRQYTEKSTFCYFALLTKQFKISRYFFFAVLAITCNYFT